MIYLTIIFVLFIALSLRYNWWRRSISFEYPRIFMYHSIDIHYGDKFDKWRVRPKEFEKQLTYLYRNGWKSYTMNELILEQNLSSKSFVLTFDDGYADLYSNVMPLLKKFNFKATIYLLPNHKDNSYEQDNTSHIVPLLSKEQILQMQDTNLIEFGAHTLNHVNLLNIDINEARNEIINSKKMVENITQKPCNSFAYPYGKFDDNIVQIVKDAGYSNAVIVRRGVWDKNTRFKICRIGIIGKDSMLDFWLRLHKIRNKF